MVKKVPLDHLVNVWVDPPHLYLVLGPAALQFWPHGSAGSRTLWPPQSNRSHSFCPRMLLLGRELFKHWSTGSPVFSYSLPSTGQLVHLCSRTLYPPLVNWVTCVLVLFTLHWSTGSHSFWPPIGRSNTLWPPLGQLDLVILDLHWAFSLTSSPVSWPSYSSLFQLGYLPKYIWKHLFQILAVRQCGSPAQ